MSNTFTKTKSVWVLAVLSLVLTVTSSSMGAAYIKFDGVEGEAREEKHRGWSDILSFGQGLARAVSSGPAGGGRASRAEHAPFSIVRPIDKSTPLLMLKANSGETIPMVTIELTQVGSKTSTTYLKYELKNVIISSHSISGNSEDRPTEEFSLNYEEIKWTYTVINPGDSDNGQNFQGGWNLVKNEPSDR